MPRRVGSPWPAMVRRLWRNVVLVLLVVPLWFFLLLSLSSGLGRGPHVWLSGVKVTLGFVGKKHDSIFAQEP